MAKVVSKKRSKPKPKRKPKPKKRKTIKFSELKRLSFCNSDKLPEYVEIAGKRRHWVGIGFVDHGPADGTEVLVVEG